MMHMDKKSGLTIWVTGLSGAGKTTISKLVYKALKPECANFVMLDGDVMREVFGQNQEYHPEARKKLAMRYCRLCHMLNVQGINVICATISMFDEIREWNRKNLENYFEVYIRVPMDVLEQRHPKDLYTQARNGDVQNVIGVDIKMQEPKNPDLVVENGSNATPGQLAKQIISNIQTRILKT